MSHFEYFAHTGIVQDPLNFFLDENYLICRGATNDEQINDLVEFYNRSIVSSDKLYLRQSAKLEYNRRSTAGGIVNTFLNPHSFEQGIPAQFSDKILQVLSFKGIQEALSEISGKSGEFKLFQTMFFDHTTTPPHQDWVYLDSRPNGHLIAAWIALEDIHPEGIRFFVYPGTQNFYPKANYTHSDINSEDVSFGDNDFLAEVNTLIESGDYVMYAPALKKGDIFFWGSRIVHGSTLGTNPDLRRRSIAAHFIPNGFLFGNLEKDFHPLFKERYGLTYTYYGDQNQDNQELAALQGTLQQTQDYVKELQGLNERNRREIDDLSAEIMGMRTSKFWKIREKWVKFKDLVGFQDK